jgi:site-specific DNA-methyltransferase (adenine-specific)
MTNKLFYGDNLAVLRDGGIPDASVDLIYLDPPFNSNATYNVLFKSPDGEQSEAQIEAFGDTWHWNRHANEAFDQVMQSGNSDAANMLLAMEGFLGRNDMMAYLVMMAVRLIELHKKLKPTGSLYLHCDSTASHYLKLLLDAIFGAQLFRNEILWKRTTTHSDSKTWSRVSDTLLFYTNGSEFNWNTPRDLYSDQYVSDKYRFDDGDGRKYMLDNMTSQNPRPNMMYDWKGFPFPPKGWRYSKETMAKLDGEGRVWYPRKRDGSFDTEKRPRLRRYFAEMSGGVIGTIWTDIAPINSQAQERLGYPTQKPLALLEWIISASSNPGDVVLDPFCGCGTAVHAAQKLGRQWIGIDITHLAISLIEKRLKDAFAGITFEVHGTPKDLDGARDLFKRDPYQFQWWATSLVNAVPYGGRKKGADGGVDGFLYFKPDGKTTEKGVVSVKGGEHIDVKMVRELANVVDSQKAKIGVLVTLAEPTAPMEDWAVKQGLYKTDYGLFPKIQILTIEQLFAGKKVEAPWADPDAFRKPTKEAGADVQGKLF